MIRTPKVGGYSKDEVVTKKEGIYARDFLFLDLGGLVNNGRVCKEEVCKEEATVESWGIFVT